MYFPEDTAAHAADPVLASIEQRARVATLIATATGPSTYRFDIRLQGEGETVFIDV
jgi:protocatechuate 3,4-dioxygenase alpha subunit